MHVIDVRNVNYALEQGVPYLKANGVPQDTRGGPVLASPVPVTTVYRKPTERVLFDPERDANPFFHLVESLWMLAGRDDLATLTPYVARMKDFSDDGGVTQPGAYGKRWRDWFLNAEGESIDQLTWAIRRLSANRMDRRVVIQMYDAPVDQKAADNNGKDIPCNIACHVWIDCAFRLSLTIWNRSNDVIWGAYGANAVHFSMLQEYLAAGVGVPVGAMYQHSDNYHAYLTTIDKASQTEYPTEHYASGAVAPFPLFGADDATLKQFDEDLTIFFDEPSAPGLRSNFLRKVACPMVLAHKAYRNKKDPDRFPAALEIIQQCQATDWRLAGVEWLKRRQAHVV